MSTAKSTTKRRGNKPAKPSADFPLFAHQNGQWAKKVRGRLHYFGVWDDPSAALNRWREVRKDLLAGRKPRPCADRMTVELLTEQFLKAKQNRVDSDELTVGTYRDYRDVLQHLVTDFGANRLIVDLAADDFTDLRASFAAVHGPHRLAKDVIVTRSLFRWGYEANLIEHPVRFGPEFTTPSRKARLKASRSQRKDFAVEELRRIVEAAAGPLKAMVLLGINAGFGQNDVACLQREHLADGFVTLPRPKTEVERRCPLWPETLAALDAFERPVARDESDGDCVFLTERGRRVVRITRHSRTDTVGANFSALLKSLGINGRRGFYGLRHSFATLAGEAKDQPAVDRIMGHRDASMSANYRHGIGDERLLAVVDVVRARLWPTV